MRLIDADKLLDMLFRADLDCESMGGVNYCIDKIEGQPTAYDVEKVVKQLDDYLFEKHCIEGDGKPEEIIKGGGVNERDGLYDYFTSFYKERDCDSEQEK